MLLRPGQPGLRAFGVRAETASPGIGYVRPRLRRGMPRSGPARSRRGPRARRIAPPGRRGTVSLLPVRRRCGLGSGPGGDRRPGRSGRRRGQQRGLGATKATPRSAMNVFGAQPGLVWLMGRGRRSPTRRRRTDPPGCCRSGGRIGDRPGVHRPGCGRHLARAAARPDPAGTASGAGARRRDRRGPRSAVRPDRGRDRAADALRAGVPAALARAYGSRSRTRPTEDELSP